MFKKLITAIDNKLYKTFDPPEQHCDGCGEPLPMYYLVHVSEWSGDFCKKCITYVEQNEGYIAFCLYCDADTIHIGNNCEECR